MDHRGAARVVAQNTQYEAQLDRSKVVPLAAGLTKVGNVQVDLEAHWSCQAGLQETARRLVNRKAHTADTDVTDVVR